MKKSVTNRTKGFLVCEFPKFRKIKSVKVKSPLNIELVGVWKT